MPEMGGFEATAADPASASARAGGHVRIVAMTAHAMTGDRERCLAAGMDGYCPSRSTRCCCMPASKPRRLRRAPARTPNRTAAPAAAIDRDRIMERLGGDEELVRRRDSALPRRLSRSGSPRSRRRSIGTTPSRSGDGSRPERGGRQHVGDRPCSKRRRRSNESAPKAGSTRREAAWRRLAAEAAHRHGSLNQLERTRHGGDRARTNRRRRPSDRPAILAKRPRAPRARRGRRVRRVGCLGHPAARRHHRADDPRLDDARRRRPGDLPADPQDRSHSPACT